MIAVTLNSTYDAAMMEIRTRLLEMGSEVELMISNSIRSLVQRDALLSESVIAFESEINILGQEIDSHCLHLLGHYGSAVQHPHFVTQALKIVMDLERICSQCAGIARNVLELIREAQCMSSIDLTPMAEAVNTSVREALGSFLGANNALARKVFQGARMVDELNDQLQRVLLFEMMQDPATSWRALRIKSISKCLETITDHASNIAETVLFMDSAKTKTTGNSIA